MLWPLYRLKRCCSMARFASTRWSLRSAKIIEDFDRKMRRRKFDDMGVCLGDDRVTRRVNPFAMRLAKSREGTVVRRSKSTAPTKHVHDLIRFCIAPQSLPNLTPPSQYSLGKCCCGNIAGAFRLRELLFTTDHTIHRKRHEKMETLRIIVTFAAIGLTWSFVSTFAISEFATRCVIYRITDQHIEKVLFHRRVILRIPLADISNVEIGGFFRTYIDPPSTWMFTHTFRKSLWVITKDNFKHVISPRNLLQFKAEILEHVAKATSAEK